VAKIGVVEKRNAEGNGNRNGKGELTFRHSPVTSRKRFRMSTTFAWFDLRILGQKTQATWEGPQEASEMRIDGARGMANEKGAGASRRRKGGADKEEGIEFVFTGAGGKGVTAVRWNSLCQNISLTSIACQRWWAAKSLDFPSCSDTALLSLSYCHILSRTMLGPVFVRPRNGNHEQEAIGKQENRRNTGDDELSLFKP
jgi:hypothetical protein